MLLRKQQMSVQAMQALDDRVAGLESILRRESLGSKGGTQRHPADKENHTSFFPSFNALSRKRRRSSPVPSERDSDNSSPLPKRVAASTVHEILRDLSAHSPLNHDGTHLHTTMMQMISSVAQAREHVYNKPDENCWHNHSPSVMDSLSSSPVTEPTLSKIPPDVAEKVTNLAHSRCT